MLYNSKHRMNLYVLKGKSDFYLLSYRNSMQVDVKLALFYCKDIYFSRSSSGYTWYAVLHLENA